MREDKRELPHTIAGEFGGVEVLDDKDAVDGVQTLRHLERSRRVLGRHGAVAPGVAARERDPGLDEPTGAFVAWARLACEVCVGILPASAPAGVEEHCVAWFRFDFAQMVD